MAIEEKPDTGDNGSGVLGDGAMHPGKYNMALARRAIRNGWPVSDEVRQLVVEQMARVAETSESDRDRVAASKVLVAADRVNVQRESNVVREETTEQHLHQHVHLDQPSELVHVDDFYGAANLLTESETAPVAGTNGNGKVQGNGVRKKVGKNGRRAASNGSGTRTKKRKSNGSN